MLKLVLVTIFIFIAYAALQFRYEIMWRKKGRSRYRPKYINLDPTLHDFDQLGAKLSQQIQSVQLVQFMITQPVKAPLFSKVPVNGKGYAFIDQAENFCLSYIWYDAGAITEHWPLQKSTLAIMDDRQTGAPRRLTISAPLTNDPLSIELTTDSEAVQILNWASSLPFANIIEKKELV